MPFKIYTYEDPYKLDKADFWNEIAAMPHFCSARTLVNGLKDVLADNIKGLICPLDDLVRHEDVYRSWTDNISLQVQQYSALSTEFRRLLDEEEIDRPFFQALQQNQNYFLEAIRLFIELDIKAAAIDGKKGNRAQELFVDLLEKAQIESIFSFPRTPSRERLKEIMVAIAKQEVEECTQGRLETERCKRAVAITRKNPLDAIVVHGVHQFSPAQLRLLLAMEKMGLTIIFLFNYQRRFSQLYASWNDIYECFAVPIHHDTVVTSYVPAAMQNPSNALACALGEICEASGTIATSSLAKLHKLYQGVQLLEFANITEYAHFVAKHVETAIQTYSESRSVLDRGNKVWSNAAVLRQLDEQVYTANRDVHTLLKIYYPEYASDRHFLSYPIGQFFTAIYRLWDYERGTILFEANAIKECLSSNILQAAPGEVLLRTFYNLEILLANITSYAEFREKIVNGYLVNYEKLASDGAMSALKNISVYNEYKVTQQDIRLLVRAIEEINEIATNLFAIDKNSGDFINFGQHFHKLEEFLKKRELSLASEQERALITALQLRLDSIKPEKSNFSGTLRDLKQGLYFYLKQKNDEDRDVGWIVKNFEQIDGDVLQSKGQFEQGQHKVYHFACVSDRDMNMTVNEQLPWPLTDEFIRLAYAPIDLAFQVYYTALGERSNFLRYALFYGLCYNQSDVRLSYVRQYGNERTEPYALLSILGLHAQSELIEAVRSDEIAQINYPKRLAKSVSCDKFQLMDMFLCPYRFFLDYVMESEPIVQGEFLYQKYFENLIIDAVWAKISGQKCGTVISRLDSIIDQEVQKIAPFFSFWRSTDIFDLRSRAKNYLVSNALASDNLSVNTYDKQHMRLRKLFGAAKFVVDASEKELKNPYAAFDSLATNKQGMKEYSLHSVQRAPADGLNDATKAYLNQECGPDKAAIPSDWCKYCVHRGNCIEFYLRGGISMSSSVDES